MREISIEVVGWNVRKDARCAGVVGEGNATALVVTFSEDWDGLAKKVTFWDAMGHNPVERTLTADLLVDLANDTRTYRVMIPPEPLAECGDCTVVIDGYTEGVRARTAATMFSVKYAPVTDHAGEPSDPTPSQAEQLQGQIDTLLGDLSEQAALSQAGAQTATEQAEIASKEAGNAAKAAEASKASQTAAAESAEQAKAAENAIQGSAEAAAKSEAAAKAAQQAAEGSETRAKGSEAAAKTSELSAAASQKAAQSSQDMAATSARDASAAAETATRQAGIATEKTDIAVKSASAAQSAATAADNSKMAAAGSAASAEKSAGEALASKTAAASSETNAAASAAVAGKSKTEAESAQTAAERAKAAAETSAISAESSATTAGEKAVAAAESAKAAAGAETAAGKAKTDAESARYGAQSAKSAAETALTGAETAKSAAESARDGAKASETAAKASETAAKASETGAAASAATATEQAESAGTKSGEAAASAGAAKDSETKAKASETAADESADAAEQARQAIEALGVEGVTLPAGGQVAVEKAVAADGTVTLKFSIPQGAKGDKGDQGERGVSITSIERTGGTGTAGTKDTYTITLSNGSASTFQVYNGRDGEGSGDMSAAVYDPQGKAQDVFEYAPPREETVMLLKGVNPLPYSIWTSIAYGDGKFVAVSGDNIACNSDGTTWVETNLPLHAGQYSVAFGNGTFIVIGDNQAAYSTDGARWQMSSFPLMGQPRAVYGDGKFVAVAQGADQAAYSTDGSGWTTVALPTYGDWRSIAHGNGRFVAIDPNNDKAIYSTDGATWMLTDLPQGSRLSHIAYGGGMFVAITDSGSSASYSPDGTSWTYADLPAGTNWSAIAYGDGKFVALPMNSGQAAYSVNGDFWAATPIPSAFWQSVAFGNGKFVAVSDRDKVACSTDGVNWSDKPVTYVDASGKVLTGFDPGPLTAEDVGARPDDWLPDAVQVGGVPIVTTYTPEGGTAGVDYAVDVPGVESLFVGLTLCVTLHIMVAGLNANLSINGSSKLWFARARYTAEDGITPVIVDQQYLRAGYPYLMKVPEAEGYIYVTDFPTVNLKTDVSEVLATRFGGTGLDKIPSGKYLVGRGAMPAEAKSPAEVAADIGPYINMVQTGGIPIVTTYTPAGGVEGVDYAADVPGVTELSNGLSIKIIPHTRSTNTLINLKVNGGPSNPVFRRTTSSGALGGGPSADWVTQNYPHLLTMFNPGNYQMWVVSGYEKPEASDLGDVPAGAYLVGNGTNPMTTKTPEQVRQHIGAAKPATEVTVTLTAAGWTGSGPYAQTVSVTGLLADQKGDIGLAQSATADQRAAARDGMISVTGQSMGTITVTADGDKPTVDIPAVVTMLG